MCAAEHMRYIWTFVVKSKLKLFHTEREYNIIKVHKNCLLFFYFTLTVPAAKAMASKAYDWVLRNSQNETKKQKRPFLKLYLFSQTVHAIWEKKFCTHSTPNLGPMTSKLFDWNLKISQIFFRERPNNKVGNFSIFPFPTPSHAVLDWMSLRE